MRTARATTRQRRPDTPRDIAWRQAHAEAVEQIDRERRRPAAALATEADQIFALQIELAWQNRRLAEIMKEKGF